MDMYTDRCGGETAEVTELCANFTMSNPPLNRRLRIEIEYSQVSRSYVKVI